MRHFPIATLTTLFLASGCSLFFGNVRVDEKSDRYAIMDLSQLSGSSGKDWLRLERTPTKAGAAPVDEGTTDAAGDPVFSDFAFQNRKTAAIISLNTSCRPGESNAQDLKKQTRLLLLGLSGATEKAEKNLTVAGQEALETTVVGKMSGTRMRLRTVVLGQGKCQYDLLYVARPETFAEHEEVFSQFVASLKLR